MLTEHGCQLRRERLWQRLPAHIDLAVMTAPQHLIYFANFEASPFVFNSQEASAALILSREGKAVLIADNPQEPFTARAFSSSQIQPMWYRCIEPAPHRGQLLAEAVVDHLAACDAKSLALESSRCPAAIVEGLRARKPQTLFHNLDADIRALRRRKLPDELALIRRSLQAAEAGLAAVRREIRPGMTEHDLYRLVQRVAGETAGAPVIVYGDFVAGPRCEQIGGPPTQRAVCAGDLVLLDYSVVLHGYRGDFCTTFVCQGQASPQQRDMQAACLAALEAARQSLRPGVLGRDVYRACHAVLAEAGFAEFFPHHAGHGIGLGHPEPPFLVPESDEVLEVGDVVTLEPGLYRAGIGGMRYEHDFVVTANGSEQISFHSLDIDNDAAA